MSKEILEGFKRFRTKAVEIGNKVLNAERKFEQDKACAEKNFDHWSFQDYGFEFNDDNRVSVDLYPVDDIEEYVELTQQDGDEDTRMIGFPIRFFYEDFEKELTDKYEEELRIIRENRKIIDDRLKKKKEEDETKKAEEEHKLYLKLKEKYEK